MGAGAKSAYDPQSSELGFFFSQPAGEPVQLDGWNA
jgi:hypothetical protein